MSKTNHQLLIAALGPILMLLLLLSPELLFAQTAGQGISATLTSVKDWIVAIANVVFVIVMVVGVIKVVGGFVQGNPNATRNLVFLVIAALVWFGFSVLVGDFSSLGAIENI